MKLHKNMSSAQFQEMHEVQVILNTVITVSKQRINFFESFVFNDINVYILLAFVTAWEQKQVWARIEYFKKTPWAVLLRYPNW